MKAYGPILYDPTTGEFSRRLQTGKIARAGTVAKNGRTKIMKDGVFYTAGQMAWLCMTGHLPEDGKLVTYKDHDRRNNRWDNLEAVTKLELSVNNGVGQGKDSTTPYRGVYKLGNVWQAAIKGSNGKTLYLGCYNSPEHAYLVYRDNAIKKFGKRFKDDPRFPMEWLP